MHCDESFDVVVVGSGLAGGIAAITAAGASAGAKVLLIEKPEVPGGRARAHARPGALHATT